MITCLQRPMHSKLAGHTCTLEAQCLYRQGGAITHNYTLWLGQAPPQPVTNFLTKGLS